MQFLIHTKGNTLDVCNKAYGCQLDVLFVTLNKSGKDYAPTTMYND